MLAIFLFIPTFPRRELVVLVLTSGCYAAREYCNNSCIMGNNRTCGEFKMADSEGTETAQIEDVTKSFEKEQPEPINEEQATGILLSFSFSLDRICTRFRLFLIAFLRREKLSSFVIDVHLYSLFK